MFYTFQTTTSRFPTSLPSLPSSTSSPHPRSLDSSITPRHPSPLHPPSHSLSDPKQLLHTSRQPSNGASATLEYSSPSSPDSHNNFAPASMTFGGGGGLPPSSFSVSDSSKGSNSWQEQKLVIHGQTIADLQAKLGTLERAHRHKVSYIDLACVLKFFLTPCS